MGKKSRKKEDLKKENNMNNEEMNENKEETTEEVNESITEVDESQNEVVKETQEINETVEEVDESQNEVVEEETNSNKIGKIFGYEKLYVRKDPSVDSEPVGIVTSNDDLAIDEYHSTDDFYKVYTSNGLEGYCVKKFVRID